MIRFDCNDAVREHLSIERDEWAKRSRAADAERRCAELRAQGVDATISWVRGEPMAILVQGKEAL